MKVLVTGATGFVGRRLLSARCFQGFELVPAVRHAVGLPGEVVVGDIGPATDWSSALSGCDAVVHLAARVHVMRDSDPDGAGRFLAVNAQGSVNLAEQAVQAGVRRFIFMSSIKVNGERTLPGKPFRAEDDPAPSDPYAVSKLEAERGLMALSKICPLEVVIVRPPLVYGPGVKGNFAKMVTWVRRGIPLPLAAIRNQRSLLAVDNLIEFIALCADRERSPLAANRVFLLSDREALSTPELLTRVAGAFGVRARLFAVPHWLLQAAARVAGREDALDRLSGDLVVDGSVASTLVGWQPVVSLEQQLSSR
jgi:nucleoside-diphosphate-sugar epimerase